MRAPPNSGLVSDDAWHRAVLYPYARPKGDFLFYPDSASASPCEVVATDGLLTDRTPLLAIGSNAAPEQLARKFSSGPPIPVVSATLHDHDVVFAAMIAHYGSIPATFIPSSGTSCDIHITFLTDEQAEKMHASEGVGTRYGLVDLAPGAVSSAAPTDGLRAYRARAGALQVDGEPRSLAAIPATDRRHAAWSELDALEWLAAGCGVTVEELITAATDDAQREKLDTRLAP